MKSRSHLPEKTCPVCQRPFSWRKKWSRDWDQVLYCSRRCRSMKGTGRSGSPDGSKRPNKNAA